MSAIDRDLARTLYEVRAMLWANAHRRHFGGRTPNIGVSVAQLRPEARSLRLRVEARVNQPPNREAKAVARLMPLPALEHWVIPVLAQAVRQDRITTDGIQSFLLGSEFDRTGVVEVLPEPQLPALTVAAAPAA